MTYDNSTKNLALRLRFQDKLAYNEISKRTGVAKSTLSLWYRNDPRNRPIAAELDRDPRNRELQGVKCRKTWQDRRKAMQSLGKKDCQEFNLHLAGCMLYWAEGYKKGRNVLKFTNTDPAMLKFFLHFLRTCYQLDDGKIRWTVQISSNHNVTEEECIEHWTTALPLEGCRYGGCTVDKRKPKAAPKNQSAPYGCCHLIVNSTSLVQQIFGSIKHYAGIDDPALWLD